MSAARSPGEPARPRSAPASRSADMAKLHARRREARRRTRMARMDLGLGLLGALVLLVATPGLAITGVIVIVVLAVCVFSFLRERRRTTPGEDGEDGEDGERPPRPRPAGPPEETIAASRNGHRAAPREVGKPRTRTTR